LKNILKFCSVSESATGFTLIFFPALVTQLLLGETASGIALIISRFAGICLLSLGIACWPHEQFIQALWGMFLYNIFIAIFLIYIGLFSGWVGILLWPVAILHFGLAVLLVRGIFNEK
jgi:hypothetical protein